MLSRAIGVCVLMIVSMTPAQAHIVGVRLGDFYAGAAHPLTDLRDIIVWVVVGLLGGSLGVEKSRPLILLFPVGLLFGLATTLMLARPLESGVTVSVILVSAGLALALELDVHRPLLFIGVLVAAAPRGAANASGVGDMTNSLLFAAGMASAGYAVVTLVMASTVAFRASGGANGWRRIALRAIGSWIAAIGIMMGGVSFMS